LSTGNQTHADQQEAARQPTPGPAELGGEGLAAVSQSAAVLQRALADPPPRLCPPEVLALQRTVGNQTVQRVLSRLGRPAVTAGPDGAIQRSPAIPNWSTRAQTARGHVQAGRTAQAVPAYRPLIADVINTIPLSSYPASLTSPPQGSSAPAPVAPGSLMVVLQNRPGGAVTFPSEVELGRGDPAQLWRWIEFHEEAIMETEEWTRGLIIHELQHAGDMVTAYRQWSARPPTGREQWLDYWGSWMRRQPERHVGIYEAQAGERRFEAWSDDEKLEWITGVLGNVPDSRPSGSSFPGSARIHSYYGGIRGSRQGQAVQDLFWEMLFGGQRDRTNPLQKVTILNCFPRVRQDLLAGSHASEMRAQISILRRVLGRRR
jgi:hypothetical protein